MKELQERIEECLSRLKELPQLIRAEREKMNGKAAIEELKTRLKGLWLGFLSDAATMVEEHTDKVVKLYPNEKAREGYALKTSENDDEYQQVSEEIKRFEHQRNTATMNHEALTKEFSALISTVDVLREMLVFDLFQKKLLDKTLEAYTEMRVDVDISRKKMDSVIKAHKSFFEENEKQENEEQEASHVEG